MIAQRVQERDPWQQLQPTLHPVDDQCHPNLIGKREAGAPLRVTYVSHVKLRLRLISDPMRE